MHCIKPNTVFFVQKLLSQKLQRFFQPQWVKLTLKLVHLSQGRNRSVFLFVGLPDKLSPYLTQVTSLLCPEKLIT